METASVSFNEGIKKILLHDYAGAISDFTRTIEAEPDNVAAYNNRGFARNKLNDTSGETSDYTKAIEINPKDEISWLNRGPAREKLNEYCFGFNFRGTIFLFHLLIFLFYQDLLSAY